MCPNHIIGTMIDMSKGIAQVFGQFFCSGDASVRIKEVKRAFLCIHQQYR